MKIAVLGAGPIGATFAGFMAMAGQEVWVVDPDEAVIRSLQEKNISLYVCSAFGEPPVKYSGAVSARTVPDKVGVCDVVVVGVKSIYTRSAAESVKKMSDENTLVLSMQNGLGGGDILEEYVPGQVGYGVIVLAGMRKDDEPGAYDITMYPTTRHFSFTTEHEAMIPKLQQLEAILKGADSPLHLEYMEKRALDKALWKKLCLNIVVNPINSLHEGPMDALFCIPEGIELADLVVEEALAVAHAKGIDLTREQIRTVPMSVEPRVKEGYRHFTSMCVDVINHRQLEIDVLNGAVVREGKRLGVPTPYNETLTLLMKIVMQTYNDRYSVIHQHHE